MISIPSWAKACGALLLLTAVCCCIGYDAYKTSSSSANPPPNDAYDDEVAGLESRLQSVDALLKNSSSRSVRAALRLQKLKLRSKLCWRDVARFLDSRQITFTDILLAVILVCLIVLNGLVLYDIWSLLHPQRTGQQNPAQVFDARRSHNDDAVFSLRRRSSRRQSAARVTGPLPSFAHRPNAEPRFAPFGTRASLGHQQSTEGGGGRGGRGRRGGRGGVGGTWPATGANAARGAEADGIQGCSRDQQLQDKDKTKTATMETKTKTCTLMTKTKTATIETKTKTITLETKTETKTATIETKTKTKTA